ncbi:MAG TPA: hypothetical protein VMG12_04920 [Polyangiaceae bacterium]|nr:hypothetical protein [Polyangiaceae bacterium]
MVGIFCGTPEDRDYAESIASIAVSDASAARQALTHACVLVIEGTMVPPPPIWRQRMAEANNQLMAERYYFALVSPKLVFRGVFTAITWLTRRRPGHHLVAFPDVAQASTWLERDAGKPALDVRRLYEQARLELFANARPMRGARAG